MIGNSVMKELKRPSKFQLFFVLDAHFRKNTGFCLSLAVLKVFPF